MSSSDPNLSPDELARARSNVELKVARIRRNRRVGHAVLALAVAAAAAVIVDTFAFGAGGTPSKVRVLAPTPTVTRTSATTAPSPSVTSPTTAAPPTTAVPTTAVPAPAAEPAVIYVVVPPANGSSSSRVVALSPTTGQVIRTVAAPGSSDPQGRIAGLYLTADRSRLYAQVTNGGTCGSQIETAPTSGGTLVPIAGLAASGSSSSTDAYNPVASPDGTEVAWLSSVCPPAANPSGAYSIIVANPATRTRHTLNLAGTPGTPLSWGGTNGNKLLLGNTSQGVETVVALGPGDQVQATAVLHAPDPGCTLGQASFIPATDVVAAVENCGNQAAAGNRLVELDASNGTLQSRIVTVPSNLGIFDFSFDKSGQWLLYETADTNPQLRTTFNVHVLHNGATTSVPNPNGLTGQQW